MSFSKNIFLVFCLFLVSCLQAQDIFVPFRDGKQWGLSNYNGDLVIEPKFDSLIFNEQSEYDFVLIQTRKNLKKGLIINGKEVLKALYDEIIPTYKEYIVAKWTDDKGKFTLLLDSYGNPIIPEPIRGIFDSGKFFGNDGITLFEVINSDFKEDMVIWDDKNKKLHYLMKDYYSLKLRKTDGHTFELSYKKNEKDPLSEEICVLENYQLKPINSQKITEYRIDDEDVHKITSNQNRGGKSRRESVYNPMDVGVTSGSYEAVKSSGYAPPLPAPIQSSKSGEQAKPIQETKKELIRIAVVYKLQDNELEANYKTSFNKPDILAPVKIKLPKTAQNIKIEKFSGGMGELSTTDYKFSYGSYVTFDNKEKKGIMILENRPLEYDTIQKLSYTNHGVYQNRLSFLVGNKEKKSQKIKYTLLDVNQKEVFPMEFDKVIINSVFGSADFNYWTIQKNEKYGIITPDGKMLLEPIYDKMENKKVDLGYGNFIEIQKGNKYGFFKSGYSGKTILVEPIFNYPIKDVYFDYPYRDSSFSSGVYNKKQINKSTVAIVALQDEKGNLVGYANKDGKLYFK